MHVIECDPATDWGPDQDVPHSNPEAPKMIPLILKIDGNNLRHEGEKYLIKNAVLHFLIIILLIWYHI